MQLKELLRISRFENYSIKIEGEKEVHFLKKDEAFESFGGNRLQYFIFE